MHISSSVSAAGQHCCRKGKMGVRAGQNDLDAESTAFFHNFL